MPVRSSTSSVLIWPDRDAVDQAVRAWSAREAEKHPELRRLGYFGSYARGDWGVGSDLDLVALISDSSEPFERRGLRWDLSGLPVPADLLVYTEAEWERMHSEGNLFRKRVAREVVWICPPPEPL